MILLFVSWDQYSSVIYTFQPNPNFVLTPFFSQQVTVIDDGKPVLSSTTSVVITIEDVNDNAPEMLKKAYRFKIPETQPVQAPLTLENGTATATMDVAEIDEQLDKKPWMSFEPNDIAGPALFRVSTTFCNLYVVRIIIYLLYIIN